MNRLLYKPISITLGIAAGAVAGVVFKQVWRAATGEDDAPKADDLDKGWTEVLAAAALQGALFALVKAIVDRGTGIGARRWAGTSDH